MSASTPCKTCGFELWNPVSETSALLVSDLALYSDARFPGRSILRLQRHEENLEHLDPELAYDFMLDIQTAVNALKVATGAERVNVAILGNAVPHIHAHLIPRYPQNEPLPEKSPWDDTRIKTEMSEASLRQISNLVSALLKAPQ